MPSEDLSPSATLREVVGVLERAYPPSLAEQWDAVGLVCGDLDALVRDVLLVVDVTAETVDEALQMGADLVVAHHPLLLRGVHGVGTDTERGRLVHRLVTGGCALFTAHTNADSAAPGVSDALAGVLGLRDLEPLDARTDDPLDQLVVFVPSEHAEALTDALAAAGAGSLGDYQRCAFVVEGSGTFEPLAGARPARGAVGRRAVVAEARVEMVLPRAVRSQVLAALRTAHPYEQPAHHLLELVVGSGRTGLGRVGTLEQETTLQGFAEHVASVLPTTAGGVRAAGPPQATVRRVAVCGGAGDGLVAAARAHGADVLVTADLRHHPASDSVAAGAPWLVDVAHWASEWPWLAQAREVLLAGLGSLGCAATATLSTTRTDPWTLRV